ncbi:MAG: MAPEG family protein [Pseudomonadota bacterium]
MSPTEITLFALIAWTFVLVLTLGLYRSAMVQTASRAPNSFSASGDDLQGFGQRLTRAHANCYEFLPAIGLILLYAIATEQTGVTDGLAFAFLGARLAQSVVHMLSTANAMILVRLVFFLAQWVIAAYWILRLTGLV